MAITSNRQHDSFIRCVVILFALSSGVSTVHAFGLSNSPRFKAMNENNFSPVEKSNSKHNFINGQKCSSWTMQLNGHVERSRFLQISTALVASLLPAVDYGNAAVPTFSEYNVGSGTLIRNKRPQDSSSRLAFTEPSDAPTTIKALTETAEMLDDFQDLIGKGAWDNIRQSLQSKAVNQRFVKPNQPAVIFSPYLGFESAKKLAAATQTDIAKAAALEKARSEASKTLLELAEFAFTNRVVFFNEEDKKSVARLAETNLEVDLDEARQLASVAAERVQSMIALLSP